MTEIAEEMYNVTFYKDAKTGQRLSQVWRNSQTGNIENPHGPAEIRYHEDGNSIAQEVYRVNNQFHRLEGPAIIDYDTDGNVTHEAHFYRNQLNADSGPAVVFYDASSGQIEQAEYFRDGKMILDVKVLGLNLG